MTTWTRIDDDVVLADRTHSAFTTKTLIDDIEHIIAERTGGASWAPCCYDTSRQLIIGGRSYQGRWLHYPIAEDTTELEFEMVWSIATNPGGDFEVYLTDGEYWYEASNDALSTNTYQVLTNTLDLAPLIGGGREIRDVYMFIAFQSDVSTSGGADTYNVSRPGSDPIDGGVGTQLEVGDQFFVDVDTTYTKSTQFWEITDGRMFGGGKSSPGGTGTYGDVWEDSANANAGPFQVCLRDTHSDIGDGIIVWWPPLVDYRLSRYQSITLTRLGELQIHSIHIRETAGRQITSFGPAAMQRKNMSGGRGCRGAHHGILWDSVDRLVLHRAMIHHWGPTIPYGYGLFYNIWPDYVSVGNDDNDVNGWYFIDLSTSAKRFGLWPVGGDLEFSGGVTGQRRTVEIRPLWLLVSNGVRDDDVEVLFSFSNLIAGGSGTEASALTVTMKPYTSDFVQTHIFGKGGSGGTPSIQETTATNGGLFPKAEALDVLSHCYKSRIPLPKNEATTERNFITCLATGPVVPSGAGPVYRLIDLSTTIISTVNDALEDQVTATS